MYTSQYVMNLLKELEQYFTIKKYMTNDKNILVISLKNNHTVIALQIIKSETTHNEVTVNLMESILLYGKQELFFKNIRTDDNDEDT